MASTRSEAFLARVVELGLEDLIGNFKAKAVTTFATMAFATEYNPQMADTSKLTKDLLEPLAGEHKEHIPHLRMLWWESWGIATADMQRNASGSADGPRKLGAPEIKARRDDTIKKLAGLTITPELDVSDQLITDCVGISDRNRLKYVAWENCTMRSLEMAGTSKDQTWVLDSGSGFLKCEMADARPEQASCATDLALDLALRRRGLAFDMSDLMSWDAHEKLRQDLMAALLRTPPPGYQKVSKQQIRRADEQAFAIMAKETEGGIKRKGGAKPLDAAIDKALNHRDYNLLLQPLAGSGGQASIENKRARNHDDDELTRLRKKVKDQADQLRSGGGKGSSSNGKGKGNSKGKSKKGGKSNDRGAIPNELRFPGLEGTDGNGQPICFAYNISGCDKAPPGGRCQKGRHVCALASCRQNHGYFSHHGQ